MYRITINFVERSFTYISLNFSEIHSFVSLIFSFSRNHRKYNNRRKKILYNMEHHRVNDALHQEFSLNRLIRDIIDSEEELENKKVVLETNLKLIR